MEPISPNSFQLDYNAVFEALTTVVVFSFIIERALSVLFESRPFIERISKSGSSKKGVKEIITLVVSLAFIFWIKFDVITSILQNSAVATVPGMILTSFVIAGGSKASLGLFRDVLGFMSSAEKERLKSQAETASTAS